MPCCITCHDMKDRYSLDNWPVEWSFAIMTDFPKLSRETRLLLAKMIRYMHIATMKKKRGQGEISHDGRNTAVVQGDKE